MQTWRMTWNNHKKQPNRIIKINYSECQWIPLEGTTFHFRPINLLRTVKIVVGIMLQIIWITTNSFRDSPDSWLAVFFINLPSASHTFVVIVHLPRNRWVIDISGLNQNLGSDVSITCCCCYLIRQLLTQNCLVFFWRSVNRTWRVIINLIVIYKKQHRNGE